ncbi:siderophore-interacting protein [Nonomuraea jiangxiensis]|uniref:Siderophore-interacting protein n=1 Tax=Nonomuraea jiangxiensis TaxID=633440 RepID=A0A1G9DLY4_9ACTN|nr:SIP domain-containing protein [Nonomuraea jiangxiensis]SDK64917.1 Siderophore-interacting protein [Nonomuraea jiangxiensis]
MLIAGDKTAVPATRAVLQRLPADLAGHALMEVPGADDVLPVDGRGPVEVAWPARNGAARGSLLAPAARATAGSLLVPAVRAAAGRLLPPLPVPEAFDEVDVDVAELWEVPKEDAPEPGPLYAWPTGEASVIRALRRFLVAERGINRRAVAFMATGGRAARSRTPDPAVGPLSA